MCNIIECWFGDQALLCADLLEGVYEPVHENLHTKEHQKRPKEEIGQVVDNGDWQKEQPKLHTCKQVLACEQQHRNQQITSQRKNIIYAAPASLSILLAIVI